MLLLDLCEKTFDTKSFGQYTVKGNEFFLQGHFPNDPIIPGVILCEMMAQNCHMLLPADKKNKVYLAKIDNARFRRPVRPGDIIKLKSKLIKKVGSFFTFASEACVDGQQAASGIFTLSIKKA